MTFPLKIFTILLKGRKNITQPEVMFLQKTLKKIPICPNPVAYPVLSLKRTASKADVCSKHRVSVNSGPRSLLMSWLRRTFSAGTFINIDSFCSRSEAGKKQESSGYSGYR